MPASLLGAIGTRRTDAAAAQRRSGAAAQRRSGDLAVFLWFMRENAASAA